MILIKTAPTLKLAIVKMIVRVVMATFLGIVSRPKI